ncbi:hypothetical protein D0T49_00710 [Paludibacter sp. 221]|uniref:hypothetical protein n=1 Tax=Paludibacter sp. 221 TaxID=2302939 RepID=UPI0013D85E5A|nr:hypothetical protein [Paludibacter sp. 221]NDV45574.1 hypothetical protein [Paludibacter sp. 221]
MKEKTLRGWLIFWTLFISVGALGGAFMMFYDTSGEALGMAPMLPYFQVLPFADVLFRNFLIPGIALFFVNGVTNLIAFYLLMKKNKYGSIAGMCCGIILMLWICIQFYIFPLNFISTIYFLFGILEVLTGFLLYNREKSSSH